MQVSRAVPVAGAAQAEPPPAASRASFSEPQQFRTDAWFLPDEELLGFVEVPAGPFLMGSDPSVDTLAFDSERWAPGQLQGAVELLTFYIGRYEVTVAQFQTFVEATGFGVGDRTRLLTPGGSKRRSKRGLRRHHSCADFCLMDGGSACRARRSGRKRRVGRMGVFSHGEMKPRVSGRTTPGAERSPLEASTARSVRSGYRI